MMTAACFTSVFRVLPIAMAVLLIGAFPAVSQEAPPVAPAPSEAVQQEVETPGVPAVPGMQPDAPAAGMDATVDQAPATVEAVESVPDGGEIVSPEPEVTEERNSTLPHDLSPWGMFMAADWVVKAVMIGLAIASLMTWTVWFAKSLELAGAKARASRALDSIVAARSLPEAVLTLKKGKGPAALMVRAATHEVEMSDATLDHGGSAGLKERVSSHLGRIEAQAARRMTRGTGILATIGSTAPFVGLFGTVWGIMNSFIGISEAQTTNLAIVAPGIAEALLATALGLVAAIPAVVIYNAFARSISGYKLMLADASAAVERLISRDLDHRLSGPGRGKLPKAAE